jgi:kynurenine formamidase
MQKRCRPIGLLTLAAFSITVCAACTVTPRKPTLDEVWRVLKTKEFVDLTHSFGPGIPHWPGFPDEKADTLFWYQPGVAAGSGFYAQYYCHVGQWGPQVDPPAHFIQGARTVDQISVKEMVLPLVVLDVHDKAARNADYTLTMDDVRSWESRHGSVPEDAFVVMRTDWAKRWPDMAAMQNKDASGISHYPGWSLEVLRYLYEERKIRASGHETTDTDAGVVASKDEFPLETYILKQNRYQVELLDNLDKVPEAGALAVVAFPKPKDGSGFPARVFAILP